MTGWEPVRLTYSARCDTCRASIKHRRKAYLIGARLLCEPCFGATPEGKRAKAVTKRARKPMTKAEGLYLTHKGRGR